MGQAAPDAAAATGLGRAGPDGLASLRLAWPVAALACGLLALYGPTYWDFLFGAARSDSQGHEPMILAVSLWLIWRQHPALAALPAPDRAGLGYLLLGLGLLIYAFGRSQQFLRLELLSQVFVLGGLVALWRGAAGLRRVWFALFFLLFVIPLPYFVILAITAPLKTSVSAVAAWILQHLGFTVARNGVVITIGQYQLLVAEACAGLNTMFTLEALGLLYANLMNYGSAVRNALLAVLVVPMAYAANVVRVLTLMLVTYYFGDDVGQGLVHGFSGLLLFAVALVLIFALDRLLGRALPPRWRT